MIARTILTQQLRSVRAFAAMLAVVPTLVWYASKELLDAGGPASANAASNTEETPLQHEPLPALPPDDVKAISLARNLSREAALPFRRVIFGSLSGEAIGVPISSNSSPSGLTAIMDGPRGAIAVINGKVYHAGDTLSDGTLVESIDSDTGSVVAMTTDGLRRTLKIRKQ